MKKYVLIILISLLIPTAILAQTWTNDPPHSRMEFAISHNLISELRGVFNDYTITAQGAETDFSDATIDVIVQTKSIDTQVEQRDEHLRSPDFFNVAKFPEMRFKSKEVRKIDGNTFRLHGDLSLNGITKPVTLIMLHTGSFEKDGNITSGIRVSGSILRSDYDLGSDFPIAIIGDEVRLSINAEMQKQ